MVQAGAMGVPFVPTLGYAGTDVIERRDDFAVVPDPFNPDERIVVGKAINPDVALFHGMKGDKRGNVLVSRDGEAPMLAQASRRVLVTVEEVVEEVGRDDPSGTYIPGIHVTTLAHASYGAHPTACHGYYETDAGLIEEYVAASSSDEAFSEYLKRYVFDVAGHEGYLQLMGLVVGPRVKERAG